MAMFKRMWTEKEIIDAMVQLTASGELSFLQVGKRDPSGHNNSLLFDSEGVSYLKKPIFAVNVEGTNFSLSEDSVSLTVPRYRYGMGAGISLTPNLMSFGNYQGPKGASFKVNGQTEAISVNGIKNASISIDANGVINLNGPNGIKTTTNIQQPSVTYIGNIAEEAGSGTSIGSFTLKYVPLLDSNGNVVGGAGTIALNFTASSSATTLYLTNTGTLPNLTGVVMATTGAMSMIHVKGASGGASELTFSGGIAGAVGKTTLEGGVNIYSN